MPGDEEGASSGESESGHVQSLSLEEGQQVKECMDFVGGTNDKGRGLALRPMEGIMDTAQCGIVDTAKGRIM